MASKWELAVEPGAVYVESDGALYTPAEYALLYGVDETVELFRAWLWAQIDLQAKADRNEAIVRRRQERIRLVAIAR